MKKVIIFGLKGILLTIIMFIGLAVSSALVGIQHASKSSSSSITPILIYSFINTLILTLFIVKSKLRGFKLVAANFTIFWGIQYFMTQIETLYFNYAVKMPVAEIAKVVASGAINAIIFSILAVLIMGKFKREVNSYYINTNVKVSVAKSLPNIVILSSIYVIIYFIFGYFVAWQFADLRYFYTGSTTIVNVFQHLLNQFNQDPILILFQLFRGFLWSALAITIINSLGNINWMTYITSGLLFSILITTPLIFTNPYMPAPVRLGHSIELLTSMLTFGVISVLVFKNKLAVNALSYNNEKYNS